MIKDWIKEQDFYKSDTADVITDAVDEIKGLIGFADPNSINPEKEAIEIVESVVFAIKNEYGE